VSESWSLSADLAPAWVAVAAILALVSLGLLVYELWRDGHGRAMLAVAVTGALAIAALFFAVLRPVRVEERGASVGARVVVLVDASRSIDLPAEGAETRRDVQRAVLEAVGVRYGSMRQRTLAFGTGNPVALDGGALRPMLGSDLSAALEEVASGTDELPQAVVVISDGRLDRPGEERVDQALKVALGELIMPIHTVSLTDHTIADAAVRSVRMAEAVVAHQPVSMRVEVACVGGLSCKRIPVVARELHLDAPAVERASGVAELQNGSAVLDLEITLDRAGKRIIEVAIDAPEGDGLPANDRRLVTVDVARDRVRLLHVAGRPTYDVRALRTWLKSDASVDVVAFFILRTLDDQVDASQDDLALIPFPVDELFTVHLSSFDAVILQDFDAQPYGLSKHLRSLADYVSRGGGLIMVGGPNAFVSGNYAGTPLASVMPVSLGGIPRDRAVDLGRFVPAFTKAGRHAPVLAPLQALMGIRLPEMPGSNVVGPAREGATVLLEHPVLRAGEEAMPVLALGEYGSGRSIALTVDGSHRLLFSEFAVDAAGRAHGAFWDALLGWLMRDPRFEPAKVDLVAGCIAGIPATLSLRAVFVDEGTTAEVVVARMGTGEEVARHRVTLPAEGGAVEVPIEPLAAGGYTATVELQQQGRSAPSRYDFACEDGGQEWADPRPDTKRLEAIAKATGGVAVGPDDVAALPLPRAARVVSERRVHPLMPAWAWTLLAAALLGGHWIARRRLGLS
jgi:uncharacterized membrane protein